MRAKRLAAPRKLKRPPHEGAWSLLIVDSAPIRDAARREYEKARSALQKARADLDRFNTQDKPSCQRWVASNFGAILTELRELHAKLQAAEDFVGDVEDEFMFGDHRSIYGAYRTVREEREMGGRQSEDGAGADGPEESPKEETQEEREFREDFEKQARNAFKEAFGFDPGEELEEGAPFSLNGRSNDEPQSGRLKEIYRALVRRLHPDAVGESSPMQLELWHQAQTAYEKGDVSQLEVILATVDVEAKGAASASVSVLKQIIAEFKAGLSSIKRLLSVARRDPAWNFTQTTDRVRLKVRFERMFADERQRMLAQLENLERTLAEWETGSRRRGSKKGRGRRNPAEFEFEF